MGDNSTMKSLLVWLLIIVVLATSTGVQAQDQKKIPRIGFLAAVTPAALSDRIEAFRQGLRELGYIEGKSIVIESRYAEEQFARLPALAAELIRLKVDVIVTAGSPATRAAKGAAAAMPIIMAQDSDPVGNGFIASLARPGGNITGLSTLSSELSGKRLELLKEVVPKLARVVVLGNLTVPGNAQALKETELAAGAYGVQVQYEDVTDTKGIATAISASSKGRADGILALNNPILSARRTRIAEFVAKSRIPAMYERLEYVEAGGLMSYGVSSPDLYRRAATYVDKILKGRKPADLPVEQPKKFEFIVNLKAAKQIGLTVPPNVLVRAERVIR